MGGACSRAHPRSRGENLSYRACQLARGGSSPLTRGKLGVDVFGQAAGGLIPAHAGKTSFHALLTRATGAHPRSRGENLYPSRLSSIRPGSSPLTRGKPLTAAARSPSMGLIPAHAGKTYQRSQRSQEPWAHPRSRGENNRRSRERAYRRGSSPLTRGKPAGWQTPAIHTGLIPAHAGKTGRVANPSYPHGAHPRSRGENRRTRSAGPAGVGSSPLTRGKHLDTRAVGDLRGLIPAHAGKTKSSVPASPEQRAHPRSRGENEMKP